MGGEEESRGGKKKGGRLRIKASSSPFKHGKPAKKYKLIEKKTLIKRGGRGWGGEEREKVRGERAE